MDVAASIVDIECTHIDNLQSTSLKISESIMSASQLQLFLTTVLWESTISPPILQQNSPGIPLTGGFRDWGF